MVSEEIVRLSLPYSEKENKTVRVYVPAHENGETFPVIYMTDGQNLFEDDTVQFGCWYTREAVRDEQKNGNGGAIIVAIHNDGNPLQRTNELTPAGMGTINYPPDFPEEQKKFMSADGEIFDDFVINTVMPTVEKQFPVKTGRKNTAFCGSSSGGLMSLFTALSHPEKYCAAGVFSPVPLEMIYVSEEAHNWIRSKMTDNMPYLYMYCGGTGEQEKMMCFFMEQTYSFMKEFYPADKLKKVVKPEEEHHEKAWSAVFRDFLHMFVSERNEL